MRSCLVALGLMLGCASTPEPEQPAAESASGSERGDSLQGFWAEYWAPEGAAETDRHVFLPDGRWGWIASRSSGAAAVSRSGRWFLDGYVLVLEADAQTTKVTCDCEHPSLERTALEPAVVERLELGECPPNDEARELDSGYACRSLGGRAFWRYAAPEAADPAPFFR